MSIRAISFVFSFIFSLFLSLLMLFIFLSISTGYYVEIKKREIESYGQLLKSNLENTNISSLSVDYIISVMPYLPEYSYFIIFDKSYNVLFYFPYYFEVDDEFVKQYRFGNDKTIVDWKNFIITYFCLVYMNGKDFGLALEIDLGSIREFRKNIVKVYFLLLPVYIIVSILFSLLVSGLIQSRLSLVSKFSTEVASGNFTYDIDYTYKDELLKVFKSVKIMKNNLINLLKSLPFSVFLLKDSRAELKSVKFFNNPYDLDISYVLDNLEKEILDYKDRKFRVIRVEIEQDLLIIVIDFTEIYEVEKIKIKFLSEISHDLRTPIAVVKSILSNVEQTSEIANAIKYLDKINQMVNRYLNFAKIKLRKISVNKSLVTIEEIITLIQDTILLFSPKIEFEEPKVMNRDRKVEVDVELFQQMFFNVLDNATKNSDDVKINLIESDSSKVFVIVKNRADYEKYKSVKDIFSGLKDTKGLGINIIKEISVINSTPTEIFYENGYLGVKIVLNYVSGTLENR
ncbi:MAG: histidine kinase dimerization/phospho-acceptor domain-containing protein [bacterium]